MFVNVVKLKTHNGAKLSLTYSDSLIDGSLCSVRVGDVTVAAVVKVTGGVLLTAEL